MLYYFSTKNCGCNFAGECIGSFMSVYIFSGCYFVFVPLAQLDRASGYGPEGRGFESSAARQVPCGFSKICMVFCFSQKNYPRIFIGGLILGTFCSSFGKSIFSDRLHAPKLQQYQKFDCQ